MRRHGRLHPQRLLQGRDDNAKKTVAKKTVRMTSHDESPDREVHRFFEQGPDGKEFKSMELIYTRR